MFTLQKSVNIGDINNILHLQKLTHIHFKWKLCSAVYEVRKISVFLNVLFRTEMDFI